MTGGDSQAEPIHTKLRSDAGGRVKLIGKCSKHYGEPVGSLGRYSPGDCKGAERRRVEGRPDPKHVSDGGRAVQYALEH